MTEENLPDALRSYFSKIGRRGGAKGGTMRAANMTKEERSESARRAVRSRWEKDLALLVKAIPVSDEELQRSRRDFRFSSPSAQDVTAAPKPLVGERWRPVKTLPSGLLVAPKSADQDIRHLQYRIDPTFKNDSRFFVQVWETSVLAWHPGGRRLATGGGRVLPKLWDVETGALITSSTFHATAPGDAARFSSDGAVFAIGDFVFDGATGEHLLEVKSDLPCASRCDFFRPHTNQYSLPENGGKYLALRNHRTGTLEKLLDSDVPSTIRDVAWHPSGRYIAMAFTDDDIRIIDVDNVRTLERLSVPTIMGWSPDGRLLIARKHDRVVLWDALETRESAIPEEIKGLPWFKRFSKNMSADASRYIEGSGIYSAETDELLATLPTSVTAAAWSPSDGALLATCGSAPGSLGDRLECFEAQYGASLRCFTNIWKLS